MPEETPVRITGSKDEQIGAVYGGFVGELEQLANGRLIAAAPLLLEYVSNRAENGDEEAKELLEIVTKGTQP
jgi:hypothetical protein